MKIKKQERNEREDGNEKENGERGREYKREEIR